MPTRPVKSSPDRACRVPVPRPRAFTVALTPTPAVVSLCTRTTPTAPPTPATPKPADSEPSITSVCVSSTARMRTLPSASTTEPVPVTAWVVPLTDSTVVEPATATEPATPRPAAMDSTSCWLCASTDTSRCARTRAPSPTRAVVWCSATRTSAPTPTPTPPAPDAAPATPIW